VSSPQNSGEHLGNQDPARCYDAMACRVTSLVCNRAQCWIEEGKLWNMIHSTLPYSNLATETGNTAKRPGDSTTTGMIATETLDDHPTPHTPSSVTTTEDRKQYKRQSETQLQGDLNRQKTYDFENPKLPKPTVIQYLTSTPDDRPTPCIQSHETTTDVRQQYKRQSETQFKGEFKRQKTSDFEIPKLPTPAVTKCPTGLDPKRQKTPDTVNIETQQGRSTHHIPTGSNATNGQRQPKRPPDTVLERDPKKKKGIRRRVRGTD
jgi:hypothetical protein